MFPRVELDPDVLHVDEGSLLTSAGSAAGIDACLHLVRQDYGAETASLVARTMVSSPQRAGGQAQFITQPVPTLESRGLAGVMQWSSRRIANPMSVPQLAARAAMSERTLLRRFQAEVGLAPKAWLLQERIRRAQCLLETTAASLEDIAGTPFLPEGMLVAPQRSLKWPALLLERTLIEAGVLHPDRHCVGRQRLPEIDRTDPSGAITLWFPAAFLLNGILSPVILSEEPRRLLRAERHGNFVSDRRKCGDSSALTS